MPKRDWLRHIGFRPKPDISNAPQASSSAVQPTIQLIPHAPSTQGLQGTSTTTAASVNRALELAIQRHLDKITDAEKEAFREASKNIDEDNLLSKARACDDACKQRSSFRPQAERLSKFLNLLNRFMGGITIGIQAYPEISCLVVGAVRIIIDLAIDFVDFFSKLADMLCQFEDYLEPLAEYAKASKDFKLVQETVANVYGDLLDFCQKARHVFVDTNGNPRKWTSWRLFLRQQWEPFETGFGPIRTKMQSHVDVLHLTADVLQLNYNREAKEERRQMERERFLHWISMVDFEKVHDDIYEKKHKGTGDWLIQKEELQTWFSSSKSSLLWCHGKPGAGKSVLASNVLEHITAKYAFDENVAICFAYYDYRSPELRDRSQIVAALVKQLCRKRDTIPSWLLKFKHDSLSPSTASTQESFITLAEELNFKEVYVVIDALDECPKRERHYIIGFITEVIKALRCAKIFVTSRKESDIVRAFEESNTPTIQIKAENVAGDIESFVRSEVQKLRNGYHGKKLYLTSDVLEARIIQTLTEKADGMFLWVNLQLESLCDTSTTQRDSEVEKALNNLPQGLDNTYGRIVKRINAQQNYMRELALNCFMWIFYAKRPLETRELQHALAANTACQSPTDLDVDKIDVIIEACGNLLLEESNTVRPIHYSVQEFFTSAPHGLLEGSILKRLTDSGSVHEGLGLLCLKYIQLGALDRPCGNGSALYHRIERAPFACYAARSFDYHVLYCKSLPESILQNIEEFLRQDTAFLAAILQIRNWSISRNFERISFPVSASTILYGTHLYDIPHLRTRWIGNTPPKYALHSASSAGLVDAVNQLVEQGCDLNEEDAYRTSPVYNASHGGHDKIVELLLGKGADANAQGRYGNALQAASYRGYDKIVELLLNKGADFNVWRGQYGSALQAASCRGHDKIIELLLSKGADVNAQGGRYNNSQEGYNNALQAASGGGHGKTVELLLNRGANVNAQGGEALQAASERGHDKTVELLLSKGADINVQRRGTYGNALQAASYGGHDITVELLLSKGANVNAQGEGYGNALQAASCGGHDKIVELLLSKGANANAQGGRYGNALQAASCGGHDKTVELLLSKGADINAQRRGTYGNALQAASCGGYDKIIELLLSKGADVNAQGGRYGNALQAASEEAYDKIVELLLSKGANVNAQGGGYGNALQAASCKGHDKIVELLLSIGADVNAQGGRYRNALQAVSSKGHDKIVELLLSKGAHINVQGGRYGNALQAASDGGHDKIVELLLSKGADVNAQGGRYGNALQAVSIKGHDKIVELLLSKGADVNAQGGRYGNALQAASCGGYDKIIELLLSKGADVNAQGGRCGNALQAASYGSHDMTSRQDRRATTKQGRRRCENALQTPWRRRHDKTVELLLSKGAIPFGGHGDLFSARRLTA